MYIINELSNGIKVLMEELPNLNSVSLGIYIKTGSKDERTDELGVAHLLEHMVFKGTEKRTAKEISEEIDNMGGHINAYTSKEITAFYTVTLAEHIEKSIEILADILFNSTFTNENLEKEKKVVIEEIRMYQDVPEDLIHDLNSEFVLDNPHGRNILGTEESVTAMTRENLISYYKDRYTTENMIISIAGKINKEEVLLALEEYFSSLDRKLVNRIKGEPFTINSVHNIIKRETNQVHLCVNTKGTSYLNKDKYVLSIISSVLGGNMSSRLFQKIREDKGLCYSVYSYQSAYEVGGLFTIYAGTTKENYSEVIEIIKTELDDISENGITQEELVKAKNQLLSSMIIGLETSKSRMTRMASSYLGFGKIVEIEDIIKDVNSVILDDIKVLAKELFLPENYSTTVLGDINEGN